MNNEHLSEQEIIRREKLMELQRLGVDAFPAATFPVNSNSIFIKQNFNEESKASFTNVCIAGRIMSIRDMGKANFAVLQDAVGRIQVYIRRDDICLGEDKTQYDIIWKKCIDIGDIIGVKGFVFTTKTGETSLHVSELTLLCKSLKPLPVVKEAEGHQFDMVTDPEFKYRQRYADLIINPEVKEVFIKRTKLVNAIRNFLNERGAMEIDTPVLQNIPGGAAARPFSTHHNALDVPMYLRIANELYLKRLIVGGFDWVYEFSRNFRNEGMDRTHNPEFTILEFYVAYKDYLWMMETTEQLLEKTALAVNGSTTVTVGGNEINFKAPYRRVTMFEAIQEHTKTDVSQMDEEQLRQLCHQLHIHVDKTMGKGKLIDEIFSSQCEKHYIQPTFITDYPEEMSPLTKKHRQKKGLVERFELMINGKEVANAYSELNDPIDQRRRFEDQVKLMERGDDEAMFVDYDFLRALEYGMPPTSGIGFGIDRICMLLLNQPSIQDVLLFPMMRPEKKKSLNKSSQSDKTVLLFFCILQIKLKLSVMKPFISSKIGETVFALILLLFAGGHFKAAGAMAAYVPTYFPGTGTMWVYFTGIALGAAAIAIILNKQKTLACYLLAGMLMLFVVIFHIKPAMNGDMVGLLKDTAMAVCAILIGNSAANK